MWDKVKNVFAAVIDFIVKTVKFFTSILGQIVFWVAVVIIVVVLLYILIQSFLKVIAGWLGINMPGTSHTEDYAILSQLTQSNYSSLMPADELKEYMAYEYAVLMDLARNIEEAGVYSSNTKITANYDPAMLNVHDWAIVCANTFVLRGQGQDLPGSYATAVATANTALTNAQNAARSNPNCDAATITAIVNDTFTTAGVTPTQAQIDAIVAQAIGFVQPSNEKSKDELVYKVVTGDMGQGTSLVPYLIVERPVTIYTYRFIDKSLSENEATKDYKTIFRAGKGGGYTGNVNFGIASDPSAEGLTSDYIEQFIRPLTADTTLNANNVALYKGAFGNPVGNKVFTIDEINNSSFNDGAIFAGEKDHGTVTYEIPLKVLADRFMPKTILLSSWYLLKGNVGIDEGTNPVVQEILQEINDIYDDACLGDETTPEKRWLLVKDVLSAGSTLAYEGDLSNKQEAVRCRELFARDDFVSENTQNKYNYKIDNSGNVDVEIETDLVYGQYNALFDSRDVQGGVATPVTPQPTPPAGGAAPAAPATSLLEPFEQTFDGTLEDDIVNDLELVLTHHNIDKENFIDDVQYKKIISDFRRILDDSIDVQSLQDIDTNPNAAKEYIIYKTISESRKS